MIEWTETARRTLDDYCARTRTTLEGAGADVDEVIEDLRRHVDEEVRAAKLSVVTEDDMRRILAHVGEPKDADDLKNVTPAAASERIPEKKRLGIVLLLLGVLLPLGTLTFELVTGISAGVLFDPVPSWFHVFAVALVPAANLWLWQAGRARDARRAKLLGWLNGVVIGVCVYYGILYLPFTPIAGIAVIYFGIGLIPLAPYLALLASALIRRQYVRRIGKRAPGLWRGAAASLGLLVVLQLPTAVTYHGLAQACSEDKEEKMHGVRLLRRFGDEELMLRACYGLLRRELDMDVVRNLAGGQRNVSAEEAREVYYRVTGRSFNSVPPPSFYTRAGRWTVLEDEYSWDGGLGGEEVAGRTKGLSLLSSRLDAVAEPDAALVYCEWTLEFKNVASQQREARAQIALPPGAVVSRLTLWVDGEEREAAFAGRSQVRAAYQSVAVVQRHDPVLVTTCGPDRVMMQCFPVPANGGVMKVRVGITAPLRLESADRGQFIWPCFLERNFGIAADLKHSLWLESPRELTASGGTIRESPSGPRPFAFREQVSEKELSALGSVVVDRTADLQQVWTPADESGLVIRQTLRAAGAKGPSRLIVVLDGSAGMKGFISEAKPQDSEILAALSEVPPATDLAVIVASDQTRDFNVKPQKPSPTTLDEIRQTLHRTRFVGGQDNLPALEAAWDLAAAVDNGAVLWIHQPEPILLSSESALRQRIERSAGGSTRLIEIQLQNGPDRVLEKLDGLNPVECVPCLGSLRLTVGGLASQWSGKTTRFEFVRERMEASTEASSGTRVGRHIDRLWARDETLRLASQRQPEVAMKLAAAHQLVTPVTGAVVLETKKQFAENGLTPADPTTVPSVPEPGPLALVAVGTLFILVKRFRSRRRLS